ncbi:MAG: heme o synthase [Thermoplasmata archaeon]|jgi:protoheme IX farnesyltransferase|nr:heme o synthase [Thermoplasmata archaeon]
MGSVSDYVQISKPRILLLLLVVAWAAMFVAAQGAPPFVEFAAVTLAGAFSVASAGAFNHVLERHRDARMGRTSQRPVASGRLTPRAAAIYASVMGALAFASLAVLQLWLAAVLTLGAIAYYVVIYTVLLKPSTPQNIVIGGFAGSFPALIGWAAATGGLAWPAVVPALVLAALVFFWTPPHFWALALLYKEDYAKAEFPMMPNVRGEASTRRQIVAYAVLTAACSLALVASRDAGLVYLGAAVLLGAVLVVRAVRLLPGATPKAYRTFFLFTIQYLGVLLLALMVDRLLPYAVF